MARTVPRPTQNEPLYVIVDAGNTDFKAMIHGDFGHEIYFSHAVLQIAESGFKNAERSYSRDESNGSLLFKRKDGKAFLVGNDAVTDGETMIGASKYTRDQLGAMVEAGLYMLYPEGHPNVILVIMHPPKITEPDFNALCNAVKGRHTFTVAGQKTPVEYVVKDLIDLDEEIAALNTFMLTEQGKQFDAPGLTMIPGKEFIVLNIGGAISSFISGQIQRNGKVSLNHQSAEPIEIGIVHVLKSLQAELLHDFSTHFEGLNSLPQQMLIDALIDDQVFIKGHYYPCLDQNEKAMRPLSTRIQKAYRDDFSLGVNAIGIVIAGGGGAVAGDYVSKHVLKHDFIQPSELDFEKRRFDAIRGASKGLINHLINKSKEAVNARQ